MRRMKGALRIFGAVLVGAVVALVVASIGSGTITSATQQCFDQASYTVGAQPNGIVSGDVNGDGAIDLTLSNYGSSTVSVLLNTGAGTFGASTDLAVGSGPQGVALSDLDHDDVLDLVVANTEDGDVAVFRGIGDGTFDAGSRADYYTGNPEEVLVGLYDGDANADLAVANYAQNTVSILLGNGDGTFGPATDFPAGTNPVWMEQGDLDGNGELDLVVPNNNWPMGVSILLGNGDGTFQSASFISVTGFNHRGPAVADFDGDGELDLAVGAYQWPSGVSVMLGNGDGTFGSQTFIDVPGGVADVVAVDMDNDGVLDLAVSENDAGAIAILSGDGDGTFASPRFVSVAGAGFYHLVASDLNADGWADIAAADNDGTTAVVLLGNATCGPPAASFGFGPTDASIFDTVQFADQSSDPALGAPIVTRAWTFGDGSTSSEQNPSHVYAKDGDYTVGLSVTTDDGRTGSTTQTVQIRTHDVAIAKLVAPNTGRAGQKATITSRLTNRRYAERVQLDFYRSVPAGFEWVTSREVNVPVTSGNKTYDVAFSYTFAADDARAGKVSFQVTAALLDARDVLGNDNTAISAPTKVSR